MKLKSGTTDEVVSCDMVDDSTDILLITNAGFGKRVKVEKFNQQGRGGQGVIAIKLPVRKGQLTAAFTVEPEDEIMLVSDSGVINRVSVGQISSQGREATGVRVMNMDTGATVASVAKVINSDGVVADESD